MGKSRVVTALLFYFQSIYLKIRHVFSRTCRQRSCFSKFASNQDPFKPLRILIFCDGRSMSFDYNRNNGHHQGESFWTSNSDLFLGLSSIFLILYVVASLRSGADGMNSATENKKLKIQVQDLENQLKTYESVKDQYMQKQASKDEVEDYNELMDKLTLLQEEAKNEKQRLTKEAKENAKKEKALNKYQQMVRNVLNANSLAKTKIINRNEVIEVQDVEISQQNTKITQLNQDIASKENQIKEKDNQIVNINDKLEQNISELKKSYKKAKLSHAAYQARLKNLKAEAANQLAQVEQQRQSVIGELESAKSVLKQTESQLAATQNQLTNTKGQLVNAQGQLVNMQGQLVNAQGELVNARGELANTKGMLASTQGALTKTQGELAQKGQQISNLNSQLASVANDTKAKIAALNAGFAAQQAQARAAFDAELKRQKGLSQGEIARREAAFKAQADAQGRKLASEMAALSGQLKETQGRLAQANAELAARKSIASEIKKGFDKMGIKADIDANTGDVFLDFGQSYFESNSANLTGDMRKVLQKAMPVYSKSLFGNDSISKQISSVEVIGFASPTYKNRIIDPNSNKPDDLEGIKYNMDLSYRRAKSIFNYILDNREMNFQYRDELVPNLKVSGRSFLDLMKQDRSIASVQEYCQKNDCKKSQRVIIRFSMDKKK